MLHDALEIVFDCLLGFLPGCPLILYLAEQQQVVMSTL